MLEITISRQEGFDDELGEFVSMDTSVLRLEHSLVSLSKWESKWEIPFLEPKYEKTNEHLLDYIKMMVVGEYNEEDLQYLTGDHINQINEYINSKQTAAWFADDKRSGGSSRTVTSDLIYYWMVALNIPFNPTENWHLNRLMTLIRIAELENRPKKSMSRSETINQHRQLNSARRAGGSGR